MFSDKFRFLNIIILLLILVGLVLFAQKQGPKVIPGFREFKKSPESFINKEIPVDGKIKKIESDRFYIEQKMEGENIILEIRGVLRKANLEDHIYAVVVYKDQKLILNRYIISNSRPIKIFISFLALFWVAFLFFQDFKFDFKKFLFQPKDA